MKKPKYKVGQVVKMKAEGVWVRIKSTPDRDGNFYITGHPRVAWAWIGWAWIGEIRPLTKRERGE